MENKTSKAKEFPLDHFNLSRVIGGMRDPTEQRCILKSAVRVHYIKFLKINQVLNPGQVFL